MRIHFHIGGGPHRRRPRHSGIRHYGYDRPRSDDNSAGISLGAALGIFIVIAVVFISLFMFMN